MNKQTTRYQQVPSAGCSSDPTKVLVGGWIAALVNVIGAQLRHA